MSHAQCYVTLWNIKSPGGFSLGGLYVRHACSLIRRETFRRCQFVLASIVLDARRQMPLLARLWLLVTTLCGLSHPLQSISPWRHRAASFKPRRLLKPVALLVFLVDRQSGRGWLTLEVRCRIVIVRQTIKRGILHYSCSHS